MTDLPNVNDLVSGTTQEGNYQSALNDLYRFVEQLIGGAIPSQHSIELGSITPSSTYVVVDTENLSSADDLTNILPTIIGHKIVILRVQSATRPVTVKNLAGGTGQIYLNGSADVVLNNTTKVIVLSYNSTFSRWDELWRNWGVYLPTSGDISSFKSMIGYGSASGYNVGAGASDIPQNSNLGALAYLSAINNVSLITDGLITGAKLSNATLSIAKLANATAGAILGWNASGLPTLITPGAAGQVLTSTGPGSPPSFQSLNNSQACVKLGSTTIYNTASGSVTWSVGTFYRRLRVLLSDSRVNSDGAVIYMRFIRSGVIYAGAAYCTNPTTGLPALDNKTEWWFGQQTDSRYIETFDIDIFPADTAYSSVFMNANRYRNYYSGGGLAQKNEYTGSFYGAAQIDGILIGYSYGVPAIPAKLDVWGYV